MNCFNTNSTIIIPLCPYTKGVKHHRGALERERQDGRKAGRGQSPPEHKEVCDAVEGHSYRKITYISQMIANANSQLLQLQLKQTQFYNCCGLVGVFDNLLTQRPNLRLAATRTAPSRRRTRCAPHGTGVR